MDHITTLIDSRRSRHSAGRLRTIAAGVLATASLMAAGARVYANADTTSDASVTEPTNVGQSIQASIQESPQDLIQAGDRPVGASLPPQKLEIPLEFDGVGVLEQRGEMLPLDATFVNSRGESVTLGQYFTGDRPVLLTLGYYNCPMLCNLVLNGMVESVNEMDWTPGEEFEVVFVGIDPSETPELAALKKDSYVEAAGKNGAADGWHFLTGNQDQIDRVAQAVGWGYRWDPKQQQFAHPAALVLVMPDGRVSRYLYGVKYDARTLRLSLVEASEGKIGSVMDQIQLFCYQFDPNRGKYSMQARSLMKLGGALTVMLMVLAIGAALLREMNHRLHHGDPSTADGTPDSATSQTEVNASGASSVDASRHSTDPQATDHHAAGDSAAADESSRK